VPADGRRVLYGRRRGRRLRPGRQRLLDEALPALRVRLPEDGGALDPRTLFDPPPPEVWLDIGFGAGEHLAYQAAAHRKVGIIGCEPYVNGVARLLAYLAERGLTNIRVFPDDARLLIDALADASVGRAFVLFPDPWPKRRHARRRVVSAETVAGLARIMTDGAELRLASDDAGQVRWMLEQILACPAFEWLARGPGGWRRRPPDWPATRYEEKAVRQGRRPVYLRFRRRRRGSAPPPPPP
jgi:tRNA (guanine-N7-)-methyltransferase